MSTISLVPGSHGSLTFTGPNLSGPKAVTLKGEPKWSRDGITFTRIDDIHGSDPKYMGTFSHGLLKFLPMADQDLAFLADIRAATAVFTNIGRTLTFRNCIMTQGDALPEENLKTGESDEITMSYNGRGQNLKT